MKHRILTFLALLGLASCGHAPALPRTDAGSAGAAGGAATIHTPRFVALPFRLDVSVSPEVMRALDAAGVKLVVSADYYGRAKHGAAPVDLAQEQREIVVRDQSVTLAGRFDAALVAREVSGDARAKVSAAAAGQDGPVVYCTEFDEALPIAVETGGHIHCELISE
ncbi:MAG: hypothetical protein ACK4MQ_10090 [Hyphomonas sp.]